MKKIFSIIFCVLIAFPLFQTFVGVFPEAKIEEKRELAEFTEISLSERGMEALTAYFNDHFGLRNYLIRWNNQVDLKLFKISPNPQVIIGNDDWYYYQPSYESNTVVVNGEEALVMAKKVKNFQDKVVGDGKKFVFVLAPNKESIYPEFLREKLVGQNNYEVIVGALEQAGVNSFDALGVLSEAKAGGGLVYSKNDTHWTRYGLFLAVNELLVGLGRERIQYSGVEDVTRVGDLVQLLGVGGFEVVPQPIIDKEKIKSEGRALILHDSFFDNEMYFTLIFKDFKKNHWLVGPISSTYSELGTEYDVVILEIAERDFLKMGF